MHEQVITIILIALVLGADAFSLAMGMGLRGTNKKYAVKFSIFVGVLHIFMPLIGLKLGMLAGKVLGIWAARIGALVLAYIGLDMLYKAYREARPQIYKFKEANKFLRDKEKTIQNGWISLSILSISVSIDALTVGFSLGTLKAPVISTVIIIGITAGSMTLLGFIGGKIFNSLIGTYSQIIGGLVLCILALKMVL